MPGGYSSKSRRRRNDWRSWPRADAFARGLLALGVGAGDHVVLWMPNRVERNVANLGIAKVGGVTVTCNSRYKAFEIEYVLRQSDAKALIMLDCFDAAGVDYIAILREICPEIDRPGDRITSARYPVLSHAVVLGDQVPAGCRSWAEVASLGCASGAGALDRIRVGPDDVAAMQGPRACTSKSLGLRQLNSNWLVRPIGLKRRYIRPYSLRGAEGLASRV